MPLTPCPTPPAGREPGGQLGLGEGIDSAEPVWAVEGLGWLGGGWDEEGGEYWSDMYVQYMFIALWMYCSLVVVGYGESFLN